MFPCSYIDTTNEPQAVLLFIAVMAQWANSCCEVQCESLKLYQYRGSHTDGGRLETMRVLKPPSNCALGSNSATADRRIWLYGGWFSKLSKGPVAFATTLQAIGVPGPDFIAWLNMLVELLGGLAVIPGAFVVLVSLPMAAVLLTAMFSVHLPYGFLSIKLITVTAAGAQFGLPGYETDLLYLAALRLLFWATLGH